MKDKLESILRKQIFEALQNVTINNSPEIYNRIQTAKGYKSMEERLIDNVLNGSIMVSAAIPQIEMELQE